MNHWASFVQPAVQWKTPGFLNTIANEKVRALRLRHHDVICDLKVLDEGVSVFPIDGHPDLQSKGHYLGGQ
jgi:hypothetical protein